MARTVAHHAADKKRTLYGRDQTYLRRYVGTHVVALLEADAELKRVFPTTMPNGQEIGVMSAGLRKALEALTPLSVEESNE